MGFPTEISEVVEVLNIYNKNSLPKINLINKGGDFLHPTNPQLYPKNMQECIQNTEFCSLVKNFRINEKWNEHKAFIVDFDDEKLNLISADWCVFKAFKELKKEVLVLNSAVVFPIVENEIVVEFFSYERGKSVLFPNYFAHFGGAFDESLDQDVMSTAVREVGEEVFGLVGTEALKTINSDNFTEQVLFHKDKISGNMEFCFVYPIIKNSPEYQKVIQKSVESLEGGARIISVDDLKNKKWTPHGISAHLFALNILQNK